MGFRVYRYKHSEEDLFSHSASLGHNNPPNPLNLSIIIALHPSLSEYSDPDFMLFVGHWV